ncbi:ABC transporter substrate-binding protein, partial [Rickettsiaceae bacterium]|nr:ABC transporter substrate-binding protein [Rickettsiaceae bacterium]
MCLQVLLLLIILFANLNTSLAEEKKIIAITAIVEHPSLIQAKNGIIDELRESGYEAGKNIEIIDKNAQGAIANAVLIAKKFVAMKPDAIVPISTSSAQTVINAAKGSGISVIFSSVTDPVAAGFVTDMKTQVENITGAIDYPLIDEEIQLIKKLLPDAKKIGFLYNAGEANSVQTIELMKKSMDGKMEYVDSQATNSNQITQAFAALVGRVDV